MPSIEELRRVIRRIDQAHAARRAPEPLETLVGGAIEETGQGPILVVRQAFALDHRHGLGALVGAFGAPPALLGVLTRRGTPAGDVRRLLFLDTETTGLAGGTGTYAFLVGAGRLEGDRFVLWQFFMRDLHEEPALLAALAPLLGDADGLVTYNGSGFDLPLLETRFVLARRPWPERWHLDLLAPARRLWGARLADCRLGTIERDVLGVARQDDVPGPLIPTLYFDYLRRRRVGALPRVFVHNRTDVLSLVALTAWLARALDAADPEGLAPDELAAIGGLWERADLPRALECYRRALSAGLDGPGAERVRLRLAWWEKRAARWDEALALWRAATRARRFDVRPWEELAKFHEHRSRDHAAARAIVTEALERARRDGAGARIVADFQHRLARLDRRLAAR
jgi:hypothetical protein